MKKNLRLIVIIAFSYLTVFFLLDQLVVRMVESATEQAGYAGTHIKFYPSGNIIFVVSELLRDLMGAPALLAENTLSLHHVSEIYLFVLSSVAVSCIIVILYRSDRVGVKKYKTRAQRPGLADK